MEDINYFVAVSHLSEDINPQESYHKVNLIDLYREFALLILLWFQVFISNIFVAG